MRTPFFLFIIFNVLFICPCLYAQEYPYLAVITGKGVNVRAGQSQNFEEIAQMKEGEEVVVVDKDYSWYKIKLPMHAQSHISSKFVLRIRDDVGTITGDKVNIRARKSLGSTILGRLNQSDLVRIREESDGWIQIEPIDQSFGWVQEDYIKFSSKTLPPPRIVEVPTRNIYKRKHQLAQQEVAQEKKAGQPAQVPNEPQPQTPQKNVINLTGVIQDLGEKSITQNIRHRLQCDDNQIFFLKGYRSIIDTFLSYKVHIEAEPLSDIQAPAPVLLVRKIQLVL